MPVWCVGAAAALGHEADALQEGEDRLNRRFLDSFIWIARLRRETGRYCKQVSPRFLRYGNQ